MNRIIENNQVTIIGEVVSEFTFDHQIYGENFYKVDVAMRRLSDALDIIPVMVTDRLVAVNENHIGSFVKINGQFRSYNRVDEKSRHLVLSVFVRDIEFVKKPGISAQATNDIFLEGYICKSPIYRKTPLGRDITDILLAVNRPYGKSDYIPCICWGRNARYIGQFKVGAKCAIRGRIQSREYTKKVNEEKSEIRNAYEVSVANLEVIGEKEKVGEEYDLVYK